MEWGEVRAEMGGYWPCVAGMRHTHGHNCERKRQGLATKTQRQQAGKF